ncbi:probable disease resistance RPP8-like protein 2 [Solanum tuberosum]|uniref:NBS-LRR type resistance protein n=1 Tax=Solanum tuberosum TaxID=4113 RepID=M1BAS7_SOLTU|nr:PREDICTED: probable disease resistance RPP8-like protein 2 [Solanum tuberosum]
MADAVVDFLVENLLQLLTENVKLIGSAKGELDNLLKVAQQLKAFLDDAAKYGYTNSEQWKVLVIEIHKTVHRAEDAIDKFLVQAKLHQERNTMGRIFDWPRNLIKVRNLAAEIKGINDQVKELRSSNQALQATHVIELPKRGEVTQGPSLENDAVVGFDDEANKVIKRLVEGPMDSVDIIPVVGMPGLGKTTLARKIYNDSKLTYEFYSIVWVYVGQECKAKDIYLRILKFFKKNIEDHLNDDVDTLAKAIGGYIKKGGRCLIVLDDVWEDEVIDHARKVFAENKKGHRIMMTTRDLRVAKFANREPHELKFLEKEESFELLVMRVFGKGSCPNELVVIGKKIAKKCGGVPLVVVVIAGALRGRLDKKDWERVDRNVVQHLGEHTEDSCLKFVKMSYDHLPREVQMCFLYCGVFPRGFDIPCWKLIRLWIAEGLIKPQPESTLEEIAEFYLTDLLNRNLVIIMQKRSDGQIKHVVFTTCCISSAKRRLVTNGFFKNLINLNWTQILAVDCVFNHLICLTFSPQYLLQNMSDLSIVFPQNKNQLTCLLMKSNSFTKPFHL